MAYWPCATPDLSLLLVDAEGRKEKHYQQRACAPQQRRRGASQLPVGTSGRRGSQPVVLRPELLAGGCRDAQAQVQGSGMGVHRCRSRAAATPEHGPPRHRPPPPVVALPLLAAPSSLPCTWKKDASWQPLARGGFSS